MAKSPRRLFGAVRRKFRPRPSETIIVLHTINTTFSNEPPPTPTTSTTFSNEPPPTPTTATVPDTLSVKRIVAATKIQACFRRHLAWRARKALKSLVKLQAVVRGAYVRRQSRMALECMQALARLQVVVRARQLHLLTTSN